MWGCGDSHTRISIKRLTNAGQWWALLFSCHKNAGDKISLNSFQEPHFDSEILPIFLLLVHCSLFSCLKEHTSRGIT